MRLIFRYLTRETYTTMLVVTSVLVLILMSHQFVHYLGDAALGRLTPKGVLQMMCIQIPLLLGFMFPLGLFIGILLTFGRFYVDNEMTIFSACGVSRLQILGMSMIFSALVTVLVAFLMLWVEPKMAWYRNHIFAKDAMSSPIEKILPGRFQTIGNWVLYSEGLSKDRKQMANVFAAIIPYTINNSPSLNIITAKKAYQKKFEQKEDFIVLAKGQRYIGMPGKNNYQIVTFDEYGVRLPNKPPALSKREEFMSMKQLWQLRKSNPVAEAELQWRIAMPISVLILALFAVPLSEIKPRQGRFAQLVPAMIIYIIYLDLLFLGREWIEKSHISGQLGLWWIHGSMAFLAGIILYFKLPLRHKNG